MLKRQILIIDGHPDPQGGHLGNALAGAYADGARDGGHGVRTLAVGQLEFPLLRSQAEFEREPPPPSIRYAQELIRWSTHIAVFYPLWVGDMPAILKGFFEQTLRQGFAATPPGPGGSKQLLTGKSARIVVTMGMPALAYRWYFGAHSVRSLKRNTLGICGIGPIRDTIFGGVGSADAATCLLWLAKMRELGARAV